MRRALPLVLLLASCVTQRHPVRFSSTPAGAQILIDGVETGFVTPATLDIADRDSREVQLSLPGYRPARRLLSLHAWREVVPWSDATTTYLTWRFPLFLPWRDVFVPIKRSEGKLPARIHVRLERN